ncbi:MAG TPA: ABC transporter ATP-binding protein [Candidatus Blautia faecavium]|uniref:ABC transporter ATP-binding protein n=1 Tax=Candidatus Blautia faecavium TaxID=2838487 RepID=A0A9D2RUZ1_9FIRM|nr:ABC transporter ATP-binding protein [Candidatus Blautia faecavium]
MKEPIIEMKNITKRFGKVVANEDVNLTLYPGEIHALLGENGAGKSTLMNILTGIYKPNAGEILFKGKKVSMKSPKYAVDLGIGMVHQHFRLIPTLTVAENVFLYMPDCKEILRKKEMEDAITECSRQFHLEVDSKALVWQLSVGEQQRVEIVKLLYRGAEVLILDEPSAVLTSQEAAEMFKVLRSMADKGKSVIIISHKMNEVMQNADRITVLKGGRVEDTMEAKDATIERLTRAVVGEREVVQFARKSHKQEEQVVLSLEDLTVRNDKGLKAIKNVSFTIHAGEIFGIAGVAGNGQKELTEAVCGLRKVQKGRVCLKGEDITHLSIRENIDKGVAFIPEDRLHMGLVPELDLADNIILKHYASPKFSKNGILKRKAIRKTAQDYIAEHEIKTAGIDTAVSLMSGGNQQKLLVAREINGDPALLVASYPVRGLDIGAAEAIHEVLCRESEKGTAILLVSEELEEIFQLSDRIGVLCDGKMMAVLDTKEADYDTVGRLMSGEKQ